MAIVYIVSGSLGHLEQLKGSYPIPGGELLIWQHKDYERSTVSCVGYSNKIRLFYMKYIYNNVIGLHRAF